MTKQVTINWINDQMKNFDKDTLEEIANFIYFEIYDNEEEPRL